MDDEFRDGLAVDLGEFREIPDVLVVRELKLQMLEGFFDFLVNDHEEACAV